MNFKIVLRSILKEKSKFLLTVIGLAIGFGGFLILQLFIGMELSYDTFHKDYRNIYRIITETSNEEGAQRITLSDGGLKDYLAETISGIKCATQFLPINGITITSDDKSLVEEEEFGLYVDEDFNHVFDFPLIAGEAGSMFADVNTIAITKSLAIKYFGRVNIVGQRLSVDTGFGTWDLMVRGVYDDLPENSSIKFDLLISGKIYPFWKKLKGRIHRNYFFTYLRFKHELAKDGKSHIESILEARMNTLESAEDNSRRKYTLQAIDKTHLDTLVDYDISNKTEARQIYVLWFISLSIILITSINFINTNTIQSASKIKLLGMVKIFGHKNPFTKILVLDAVIKSILALAVAFLTIGLLNRAIFEQIFHFSLYLPTSYFLLIGSFICLAIGLTGGLIPANYLRKKRIVDIVKGKILLAQGKYSNFKLTSIIVQLTIVLVLMTTTSMVIKQLDYFESKELGYDRKNKVIFSPPMSSGNYSFLKFINSAKSVHYIKHVGVSWFDFYAKYRQLNIQAVDQKEAENRVLWNMVNSDYLPSMGISLKEGNNFRGNNAYDTLGVIINEAASKMLNGKGLINSMITADVPLYGNHKFRIIGIMEDFHFESFSNSIEPLVYFCLPFEDFVGSVIINYGSGGLENLKKDLPDLWKNSGAETPLEYEPLEIAYAETHKEQNLLASVSRSFTMLTVFLALFGLLAYLKNNIQAKTKELAIRRILGATALHVYYSLNKEILILYLISIVIAVPIGFYVCMSWLAQFAYHTRLSPWSFILPIGITLMAIICIGLYELFAILSRKATEILKDE